MAWAFLVQLLLVRALAGGLLVPAEAVSVVPCRLDVNFASAPQLQALPGIGPSRAEALVLERLRHGPFRSLADLQRVHGFGPKTIASLADYVAF